MADTGDPARIGSGITLLVSRVLDFRYSYYWSFLYEGNRDRYRGIWSIDLYIQWSLC